MFFHENVTDSDNQTLTLIYFLNFILFSLNLIIPVLFSSEEVGLISVTCCRPRRQRLIIVTAFIHFPVLSCKTSTPPRTSFSFQISSCPLSLKRSSMNSAVNPICFFEGGGRRNFIWRQTDRLTHILSSRYFLLGVQSRTTPKSTVK